MNEQNKTQTEEELWDLISEPVDPNAPAAKPAKAPRQQKSEGKFSKPRTASAPESKPASAPEPKPAAAPSARKIDGFFIACMAGVAAVSVAVTLLLGGMLGGGSNPPVPGNPVIQDPVVDQTDSAIVQELQLENAELRAMLEQQKKQIKDLQSDLLKLMGSEEYLATIPSTPEEGGNEVIDAQVKAYEIFAQIQDAYADFDMEKLEELIPQMDELVGYLSSDALSNYYKILEYMEQPSNR